MNITVANGFFSSKDAEELITQMIHIKIRYLEGRINSASDNTEDLKMRERSIVQLQKELFEMRRYIQHNPGRINLNVGIEMSRS